MSGNWSARYCGCGARLARDNPDTRCSPCQQKARDLVVRPPEVPPEFWDTEQLRDALASRHMGSVVHAYRHHPFHGIPLPQGLVAGWLGIGQAQLSRIEHGLPITDLDRLIFWAQTLRIPARLLWFDLPGQRRDAPQRAADRLGEGMSWSVSAQYEQLTGWLWTDSGDHAIAQRAYDQAVDRATEAGDRALAGCVTSARQAGRGRRAARQERQNRPADEPPWISHFVEEQLAVHRGICLTDLGEASPAIEVFDQALTALPGSTGRGGVITGQRLRSAQQHRGQG